MHDEGAFRLLNVIDEYTQECLAIRVERNLDHENVQECLQSFSEHAEFLPISAQVIALNSLPTNCANGSADWVCKPDTLNRVADGRMATLNHSTIKNATSCSMAKFSSPWKQPKP